MNSSYVQQLTNPELQTQDSTQKINFIQQWFKQQKEMEHSGQRGVNKIFLTEPFVLNKRNKLLLEQQ